MKSAASNKSVHMEKKQKISKNFVKNHMSSIERIDAKSSYVSSGVKKREKQKQQSQPKSIELNLFEVYDINDP